METPMLSHFTTNDFNSIYEPAEDSFLFLDALEEDSSLLESLSPLVCLEIGSGSGVIVTALASKFQTNTTCLAIDVNPAACLATTQTALANSVKVETVTMDLATCIKDGTIDLLVFNPPYVPTDTSEVHQNGLSRAWAGGVDGREVIDKFLIDVSRLLSCNGMFYLVLLKENKPLEIELAMKGFGFYMTIVKERKIRGEHLLVARFARNIKS